jgi:hypothetical protein
VLRRSSITDKEGPNVACRGRGKVVHEGVKEGKEEKKSVSGVLNPYPEIPRGGRENRTRMSLRNSCKAAPGIGLRRRTSESDRRGSAGRDAHFLHGTTPIRRSSKSH